MQTLILLNDVIGQLFFFLSLMVFNFRIVSHPELTSSRPFCNELMWILLLVSRSFKSLKIFCSHLFRFGDGFDHGPNARAGGR